MQTTLKPFSLVTSTLLLSLVSPLPLKPNYLGNLAAIAQEPTPQSGNRFPRTDRNTNHGTILQDDDDNHVSNQQQGTNPASAADHPINDSDEETSPSEINEHPIPSWLNPDGRGRILKPSGSVLHDDDDDDNDVSNQQQGTNPASAADHPINDSDEETNPSEINEHPRPSWLNPDRNRWILKPSGTVLQDDDDNPQPQSPQSRPPQRR